MKLMKCDKKREIKNKKIKMSKKRNTEIKR